MAPPRLPTVTLIQPTLVHRPFHREGWVYEEKVDGWRMVAYKVARTVKLVSRNGLDHTGRFPGIVAALRKLDANGLILDGEVAVYDAQLVSRFEWLRHASPQRGGRAQTGRPGTRTHVQPTDPERRPRCGTVFHFRCRKCCGLGYRSQRKGREARGLEKAARITATARPGPRAPHDCHDDASRDGHAVLARAGGGGAERICVRRDIANGAAHGNGGETRRAGQCPTISARSAPTPSTTR